MLKTFSCFLLILILIFSFQDNAPKHFENSKKINYNSIPLNSTTDMEKEMVSVSASLRRIKSLSDLSIKITSYFKNDGKIEVVLYKNNKRLIKFNPKAYTFSVPPMKIEYADIDGNGFIDLKFWNGSGGCGLAGQLSSKTYLMNHNDSSFTCFSFSDFACNDEFDLNNDRNYEIISCIHTNYNNHAYWVYNTYNFRNDSLINTSKEHNYPLWTRHLNYSNNKVTTIVPIKTRLASIETMPEDFYISKK